MEPTPGTTRRAVLTVAVAVGVVGFTTTAITVGTRGMAAELSLSTVELGWVVNAYLVAAAALVVAGGRLGDVLGRTRTFGLGLAVFAVGSIIGIVASGFAQLVVARVVQGVGAALILPSSIEVLVKYSRAGHESGSFRWRGLVYASSFAVGPLVGGVLTDWYSWRWIFGVDAVLAVGSLGLLVLVAGRQGRGEPSPTRDFVGASLLSGVVGLTLVLAERLPDWGATSPRGLCSVAVLVLLVVLLVRHERRTIDPLVHPDLLRDRRVLGANIATIGASLGMLSLLYFFNLFAQSAATFDAEVLQVALALGPFVLSMWACAAFAGWLGDRVGPRGPAIVGLGMMVLGFALLSRTTVTTSETDVVVPLALAGIGAGIANASLTGVAVLHLPAGRMNEAAGWLGLSRFVGSAIALGLGTAAFLSVAPTPVTVFSEVASPPPASVSEGSQSAFDLAIATLDRDLSGPLTAAAQETTSSRFARTMGLTAWVLAVITVVSALLLRPPRPVGVPPPRRPGDRDLMARPSPRAGVLPARTPSGISRRGCRSRSARPTPSWPPGSGPGTPSRRRDSRRTFPCRGTGATG